jgi:hypothetical protein
MPRFNIMSVADALNIGRTTKRYLTNICILGVLFGILYWDSTRQNDDFDLPSKHRGIGGKADPELKFGQKWDVSDSKALIPKKMEQTTPAMEDHTPGETEGLGVFRFFENLWRGEGKAARLKRKLHPGDGSDQPPRAFSMRVTNEQINKFHTVRKLQFISI